MLTLYIQHEASEGRKRANRIPAPAGPFFVAGRFYGPEASLIDDSRKERVDYYGVASLYRPNRGFTISEDKTHCICSTGKRLYRNDGNVVVNGQRSDFV